MEIPVVQTLAYFMPIFWFLLVFILAYALFAKTKILGEKPFTHLFAAFVIAIIFVVTPAAKRFTELTVPWLVVFLISLVFILLVLALVKGKLEDIVKSKVLAVVVVAVLTIIFLIAAGNVFGPAIRPYIPGANETGGIAEILAFKHIVLHPAVLGAILLLVIAAAASWILTKK